MKPMNRNLIVHASHRFAWMVAIVLSAGAMSFAAKPNEETGILNLGTITAGTEQSFEAQVEFESPVVGGNVSPSCGCIGVKMDQISETKVRVSGTVRAGNDVGQFTKHLDIEAVAEKAASTEEPTAPIHKKRLQLAFNVRPAVELMATQIVVASHGETAATLSLQSGTIGLDALDRPPELVGPWVVSSQWDGKAIQAVLKPDGMVGDSVEHHVKVVIQQNAEPREIFLTVPVVRQAAYGVPLREWTLSTNDVGDAEGTLWLKGVSIPPGTRTADVTVVLRSEEAGEIDRLLIEKCPVTAMGTILRKVRFERILTPSLRDLSSFVAEIHVGKQVCSIPVTLTMPHGAK